MKQIIKAAVATLMCGVIIGTTLTACDKANTATEFMNYYEYADSLHLVEFVDSPKLDFPTLKSRNGNLIIERAVGEVLDDEGNGVIYGLDDYNYISYRYVEGASKGDVICSYFIYSPDSDSVDDIVARYDYIIDDK